MRYIALIPALTLLAACGPNSPFGDRPSAAPVVETAAVQTPVMRPPAGARTADQFDTTSAEDRAAAVAVAQPAGETQLGTTIATLGAPADPGIWLQTALVSEVRQGRVEYQGRSVNVELRPGTGGARISLAAMRLIEAPLTGLPELVVYAR